MSEQVEVLLTSSFQESFESENLKATRTEIGTKSSANSRLKTLQGQVCDFLHPPFYQTPAPFTQAYYLSFNLVLFYCSLHQCLVITTTSLQSSWEKSTLKHTTQSCSTAGRQDARPGVAAAGSVPVWKDNGMARHRRKVKASILARGCKHGATSAVCCGVLGDD